MKKLVAALAVVVVLAAAGGAWYVFLRPHDRLAAARSLMSKGDARSARLELRNVLLSDPGNAEAHYRLGVVQLRLGDAVAAERELTEAQQRGWSEQDVRPQLAEAVLAQGRSAEVLQRFKPDGLPPDKASAVLVMRSDASLALHQPAAAAAAAAQAEQLAPHDVGAALASADAAASAGNPSAAHAAIARALAIDPHSMAALLLQAQDRDQGGDRAGALASLDAAIGADPAAPQPRFARAQLLEQMGRTADASADAAVLLKANPRSPGANYLQADILARMHKYAEADAALQAAGPALSRVPHAELLRAVVKSNLQQPEQAADAATRYLAQAPDDPVAYRLVASLALQGHRPAEASDILNRAATLGHADATSFSLLGEAESQLGHTDAAIAALQQAVALAPTDRAMLAQLAQLQLGRGDAVDAASHLETLLDLDAHATQVADHPAATGMAGIPSRQQAETALVLAALQAGEIDRAAAALDKLRRDGAAPGPLQMLTGLLRSAELDLPAAARAFQAAVADPGLTPAQRASARIDLAGVLDLDGHRDQAAATLREVLAGDPANLQALAALQRLLLASGQSAEAIKVGETAHAAAPDNPVVILSLADLYDRAGQADRALALLDAKPRTPPAGPTRLALQGARVYALLAAHKRTEAESALRAILAEQPTDLAARRALIGLLLADHDTASAQTLIDEGLAAVPGAPVLLGLSVSTALQSGGIDAAVGRADALARDPANQPAARMLKGEAYITVKDYRRALDAFTAELHAGDAPPVLVLAAAQAAQQAGETDTAAGLLRAYLATHPDAAEVGGALSGIEINAKRLDSARAVLQQVLARTPDSPAALNNMAWVEAHLPNPQSARAMAQRAWLLASTPQAADTLGWILLDDGSGAPAAADAAKALDLLRQAASSLPDDPSIQYHYAAALKANGQAQAARPILSKLATAPAFDEQADARRLLDSLPPG